MADTKFDLCNRALARVGGERIASFEDGSAAALACADEYEGLVRSSLSGYRWRFATDKRALQRLNDTPADEWLYAWQLPVDCLNLHGLTVNGRPVIFDRYGDKVFTNEAEGVVADFTFRADESRWPGYFSAPFVTNLAALLAMSLNRDTSLASALGGQADDEWRKARSVDSQQQTARRLRLSRLIAVRS